MADHKTNPDELGALWIKTNERGEFMTGTLNGVKVVAFRNTKKTKPNQPDWRILKSKPQTGATSSHNRQEARADYDDDGL
jgi:uncharacterized protein (DUF736 family)